MVMFVPVVLVQVWAFRDRGAKLDGGHGPILPTDAPIHIAVSWAVGALMSFLADTYRRQMFVNHRLAATAAEKELRETQVGSSLLLFAGLLSHFLPENLKDVPEAYHLLCK